MHVNFIIKILHCWSRCSSSPSSRIFCPHQSLSRLGFIQGLLLLLERQGLKKKRIVYIELFSVDEWVAELQPILRSFNEMILLSALVKESTQKMHNVCSPAVPVVPSPRCLC